VRFLGREAVHLVLDAGAVPGPDTFDLAGEHRAAVEARADDLVRAAIRLRDPARHLPRMRARVAEEAEDRNVVDAAVRPDAVTGLLDEPGVVDGAAVEPRRSPRLQPPLRQPQLLEPRRKRLRRRFAGATARVAVEPDVDPPIEEGAGREDHAAG
jgi:hypothetical protein